MDENSDVEKGIVELSQGDGSNEASSSTYCRSIRKAFKSWLARAKGSKSEPMDPRDPRLHHIIRKVEEYPEGYPRLSAHMASDGNFRLYRRFTYLHIRLLLEQQYKINKLEHELDGLDGSQAGDEEPTRLRNRTYDRLLEKREAQSRPRTQVFEDIRAELLKYGTYAFTINDFKTRKVLLDELLEKSSKIESFQGPSNRDYKDWRRWFDRHEPLLAAEQHFIRMSEDILTLRQDPEPGYVDDWIEKILSRFRCKLMKIIFCPESIQGKCDEEGIFFFSKTRLKIFGSILIVTTVSILLVLPIVALYKVNEQYATSTPGQSSGSSFSGGQGQAIKAMAILIVFTLTFCGAMSVLTSAKRQELFAGSAAYCAVLVVFVSNLN